jgi:cyanobactin maturation PatA/PatG family protease
MKTSETLDLGFLWSRCLGDSGICVAVLDGPVFSSHDCFAGAQIESQMALAPPMAHTSAAVAHGTHVASVIFGRHGSAIDGIAPLCRGVLIPVFTDGADGSVAPCSQLDLARAIGQAVNAGAQIINVSGGQYVSGGQADDHLARAVSLCASSNVLIVAAVGNDGCECLHVPASIPSVLGVGAADIHGKPLASTNWGGIYDSQAILAPGENIEGASPDGQVALKSGASIATAIVSGVVGLFMSIQLQNGMRPDAYAIRDAFLKSALRRRTNEGEDYHRSLAGVIDIVGASELLGVDRIRPRRSSPPIHKADDANATSAGAKDIQESHTNATLLTTIGAGDVILGSNDSTKRSPTGRHAVDTATTTNGVSASDCGCHGGAQCSCAKTQPALVYALGALGIDFESESRRDSFIQAGVPNPDDTSSLLSHFATHPASAGAVIWTLNQDTTPIYAIVPSGPFAVMTYQRLHEFMAAQLDRSIERISAPGRLSGSVRLINGQIVPILVPEHRGLFSWTTQDLVQAVAGSRPKAAADAARHKEKSDAVSNFLERIYFEVRNLGITPQERAMNSAATNAFQIEKVYEEAVKADLKLASIGVERSPLCRIGADCWDVSLTFFNPSKRYEQAKRVYRFTIDVGDVIPVTVGPVRAWDMY